MKFIFSRYRVLILLPGTLFFYGRKYNILHQIYLLVILFSKTFLQTALFFWNYTLKMCV